MIGICATDRNNAIGFQNRIPWNYPEDLKWFKHLTYRNIVVMGRKTFSSLNEKPLEGRLNIVITSELKQSSDIIYLQKKESITTLKNYTDRLIFIIGGGQIFSLFKYDIEEWLITRIPINISKANIYMPNDYLNEFLKLNEYRISENLICEHFIKKSKTPNANLIDHIKKYTKNI